MVSHCANPNCKKPLHYLREGKVFLFSRKNSSKDSSDSLQLMEHYWLCGECARRWTLTMEDDRGVHLSEKKRHRPLKTYRRSSPLVPH